MPSTPTPRRRDERIRRTPAVAAAALLIVLGLLGGPAAPRVEAVGPGGALPLDILPLSDTPTSSVLALRVPAGPPPAPLPEPATAWVALPQDGLVELRLLRGVWFVEQPGEPGAFERHAWADGDADAPPAGWERHLALRHAATLRGFRLAALTASPEPMPPGDPAAPVAFHPATAEGATHPATRLVEADVALVPRTTAVPSARRDPVLLVEEPRHRALLARVVTNPAQLPERVALNPALPPLGAEGRWIELLRRADARGLLLRAVPSPGADGLLLGAEALAGVGLDAALWEPAGARVFRAGEELPVAWHRRPGADARDTAWELRWEPGAAAEESPLWILSDAAPLEVAPPRRLAAPDDAPGADAHLAPPRSLVVRPAPSVTPPGGGADLVIIAADGFEDLAATLARERSALGWRPAVFGAATLGDAFGWGEATPSSVATLAAYALRYWGAPRPLVFLFLGGDVAGSPAPAAARFADGCVVVALPGADPGALATALDAARIRATEVAPGTWMERHLLVAGPDEADDSAAHALDLALRREGIATALLASSAEPRVRDGAGTWHAPRLGGQVGRVLADGAASLVALGSPQGGALFEGAPAMADLLAEVAAASSGAAAASAPPTLLLLAPSAEATDLAGALVLGDAAWRPGGAASPFFGAACLPAFPPAESAACVEALLLRGAAWEDASLADLLAIASLPLRPAPLPATAGDAPPAPAPAALFAGDPTLPAPWRAPASSLLLRPDMLVAGRDRALLVAREGAEGLWGWADLALVATREARPLALDRLRVRGGFLAGEVPLPDDLGEERLVVRAFALNREQRLAWRAVAAVDRVVPLLRWENPRAALALGPDGALALDLALAAPAPLALERATVRLAEASHDGRTLFERSFAFEPGARRTVSIRARVAPGATALLLTLDPGLEGIAPTVLPLLAWTPKSDAAASAPTTLALLDATWRDPATLDLLLLARGGSASEIAAVAPLRLEASDADGRLLDTSVTIDPPTAEGPFRAVVTLPPDLLARGARRFRVAGDALPQVEVPPPALPDLAIVAGSARVQADRRDGTETLFVLVEVENRGAAPALGLRTRLERRDGPMPVPLPSATALPRDPAPLAPGARRTVLARWDPDGPIAGVPITVTVEPAGPWPDATPADNTTDIAPLAPLPDR